MIHVESSDIPFGERLLLWSLRMWVRAYVRRYNDHPLLQNGFKLAGAPAAYLALDDLMSVFATASTSSMDIRCPNCSEISADEHCLLTLVAEFQHGSTPCEAEDILGVWLPPAARRVAQTHAKELAEIFKQAKLLIRSRPGAQSLATRNESTHAKAGPTVTIH